MVMGPGLFSLKTCVASIRIGCVRRARNNYMAIYPRAICAAVNQNPIMANLYIVFSRLNFFKSMKSIIKNYIHVANTYF